MDIIKTSILYNGGLPFLWLCAIATGKLNVEAIYWIPLVCINVFHLWAACKSVNNHKFNQYAFFSLVLWVLLTWAKGENDRIEILMSHIVWTYINYYHAKYFWRMWKNKSDWENEKAG